MNIVKYLRAPILKNICERIIRKLIANLFIYSCKLICTSRFQQCAANYMVGQNIYIGW